MTFMYEYSIYIGPHSFSSFQFLLCHIIHSITYGFWIGEKKPLILKKCWKLLKSVCWWWLSLSFILTFPVCLKFVVSYCLISIYFILIYIYPVDTIDYCLYVSKSDLLVLSNPSETLSLEKNDFHLPMTTSCLAVLFLGLSCVSIIPYSYLHVKCYYF